MNPEMQQALIARARRARSEAMAALMVAAARGIWRQLLRLRRAVGSRPRAEVRAKSPLVDSLHRQVMRRDGRSFHP